MIYATVDGVRRQPLCRGERSICSGCGGLLYAVIGPSKISHWRHQAGDCDSWSEGEGEWHLGWKSLFPVDLCEVSLTNDNGDNHRADVCVRLPSDLSLVLELQHSSISLDEMLKREAFYKARGRMFWLVHLYQAGSVNSSWNFLISLNKPKSLHTIDGKEFEVHQWIARGDFLFKWMQSTAHVFLDVDNGGLFYLASRAACAHLVDSLPSKHFAVCRLSRDQFFSAVGLPVTPN